MSRPSINQFVLDDLECQKCEIIKYRLAVGSGIDNNYDPVLDDDEIVPALNKVIEFYKRLK